MKFKSSLDRPRLTSTIVVTLVMIYAVYRSYLHAERAENYQVFEIEAAGALILYVLIYCFSVSEYILEDGVLTLWRPIAPIHIPLSDILSHRMLGASELSGMIRTFGVGGLFGSFGRYRSRQLGAVRFYSRNRKNPILLETRSLGPFIITPDDPGLAFYL